VPETTPVEEIWRHWVEAFAMPEMVSCEVEAVEALM
jgi:hypothetical protein